MSAIKNQRLDMSNNNRRDLNDTEKMFLLSEVGGICPLCHKPLLSKKTNKKDVRVFDIVHIYPLNPTAAQLKELKNEAKLSEDLDSQDNMIPLCKICHKLYDTNLTSREYQKLFVIKKNAMEQYQLRQSWGDQQLHSDISKVVSALSNLDESNIKPKLSYYAVDIDSKIDDTLGYLEKITIQGHIKVFYTLIYNVFKDIEQKNQASMMQIYTQVKSYYYTLLSKGHNQKEIVDGLSEWLMHSAQLDQRVKADILVAFFIQNCEVFSSATSK